MAAAHGAAGQPPQAPQAPAFTPYPDTKLSPCVRLVEYHMDNTCGTNKSQFMFGALATAPLRGYVDAIKIEFMVVTADVFQELISSLKVVRSWKAFAIFVTPLTFQSRMCP